MDLVYVLDNKRRVVLDVYTNELVSIDLGSKKEENIVSVIHYAIQRLDRTGKEKFGAATELTSRQIFMNDETLDVVRGSSMWMKRVDDVDPTLMGDLYKIGVVHQMKTMPGSRVQLYIKVNSGEPFMHTLFGLIDVL